MLVTRLQPYYARTLTHGLVRMLKHLLLTRYDFCTTFSTETRSLSHWRSAFWTEEVRQRQFRATVLTKFSRRSHTPARRTHDRFRIARRTKTGDGCWRWRCN